MTYEPASNRLVGSIFLVHNIKYMLGKRFEKELEMVSNALENEQGEKEFIKYITPFVESAVDKYIAEEKISNIPRNLLIKAGWTHLHIALKKYKGRAEMMINRKNDVYYFSTYFNWYIKQGILEYLKTQ